MKRYTYPPGEVTAPLWAAYAGSRSIENRNALVEAYLALVQMTANRMSAKLPACVEVDDLVSYGVLGLIDAVERFDQSRGLLFSTYARRRIFGAIIDQLRHLDIVPRLVRQRTRDVGEAAATLRAELGREPTRDELAAEMGLSGRQLGTYPTGRVVEFESLDTTRVEGETRDQNGHHHIADARAKDPAQVAEDRDLADALLAAPYRERERRMVAMYYCDEQTMRAISRDVGTSESRVSQVMAETVAVVRARAAEIARTTGLKVNKHGYQRKRKSRRPPVQLERREAVAL